MIKISASLLSCRENLESITKEYSEFFSNRSSTKILTALCNPINCDFINNTVGGLFQCSPQNGIENCNFYNNTIKSYLFSKVSSGTTILNTFLNSYLESCTFINL